MALTTPPPKKPVYGPTEDTPQPTAQQSTTAGFSSAPSMYGTTVAGPKIGGFGVAGEKMYGVKNAPIGTAGGTLSLGVNPGGGLGGRVKLPFKKGGAVKAKAKTKKMAKGGSTASKRGDGCAQRGKTKGKMV